MATMAEQINKSISVRHMRYPHGRGCWGVEGLLDAAIRWHEKNGAWPRPRDWASARYGNGWPHNGAVYHYWDWATFIEEAQELAEKRRTVPVP